MTLAEIITWLEPYEKKASELPEDQTAYDIGGGNYDDAYYAGSEHGEAYMAKEILKRLREVAP